MAAIGVNYTNRWAHLVISGQWLTENHEERIVAVVHELIHINMEPLWGPCQEVVIELDSATTRQLAEKMLRNGMECAVEDLARGLFRIKNRP